jgi:hypothetical protein
VFDLIDIILLVFAKWNVAHVRTPQPLQPRERMLFFGFTDFADCVLPIGKVSAT